MILVIDVIEFVLVIHLRVCACYIKKRENSFQVRKRENILLVKRKTPTWIAEAFFVILCHLIILHCRSDKLHVEGQGKVDFYILIKVDYNIKMFLSQDYSCFIISLGIWNKIFNIFMNIPLIYSNAYNTEGYYCLVLELWARLHFWTPNVFFKKFTPNSNIFPERKKNV